MTHHDEQCRVAIQREGGAGDAEVRDGLPGRRRSHRDGGRDPGAVPAGPRAGQLDGHRRPHRDPRGIHLRPGVLRGSGLQSAGVADQPDQGHQGAAVGYTAWVRRAAAHPEVAAALAAGEMSESFARTICTWTDKLPEDSREIVMSVTPELQPAKVDTPVTIAVPLGCERYCCRAGGAITQSRLLTSGSGCGARTRSGRSQQGEDGGEEVPQHIQQLFWGNVILGVLGQALDLDVVLVRVLAYPLGQGFA